MSARLETMKKNNAGIKAFRALNQKQQHFIRYSEHDLAKKANELLSKASKGHPDAGAELLALIREVQAFNVDSHIRQVKRVAKPVVSKASRSMEPGTGEASRSRAVVKAGAEKSKKASSASRSMAGAIPASSRQGAVHRHGKKVPQDRPLKPVAAKLVPQVKKDVPKSSGLLPSKLAHQAKASAKSNVPGANLPKGNAGLLKKIQDRFKGKPG